MRKDGVRIWNIGSRTDCGTINPASLKDPKMGVIVGRKGNLMAIVVGEAYNHILG